MVLSLWLLGLCSTSVLAGEPNSAWIQDATGRSVEIKLPVKRLVVLTSDALEIVRALNAENLVVGVFSGISKDAAFWPTLKDRPKVGTWKAINYERVVALRPDAVLSYGQRPGKDMEKKLRPFGVQVIRLDFFRPEALQDEVTSLASILGRERDGKRLVAWYGRHLDLIQSNVKGNSTPPDVYIEGDSNYHTTGPGSGGHAMCLLAGGHNIASSLSIPYPEVTPEWILAKNPDVIVKITTLTTCGSSYAMAGPDPLKRIRDLMMARPAWAFADAVRQGRVHVLANEIWTGPRAIIGMAYLAHWFYPGGLRDLDPEMLHRQYLEDFQGIPYGGVYAYPKSDDGRKGATFGMQAINYIPMKGSYLRNRHGIGILSGIGVR